MMGLIKEKKKGRERFVEVEAQPESNPTAHCANKVGVSEYCFCVCVCVCVVSVSVDVYGSMDAHACMHACIYA